MESPENQSLAGAVSFDEAPIVQVESEGTEYRVDAGRGSSVAISVREVGRWTWAPLLEGRWDGVRLKAKGLARPVVVALEAGLLHASRNEDQ
jgi:hypothetical protein